MKKKRFYKRRFLNRPGYHAGAYILAIVDDSSESKIDSPWVDITFTIADCGRQIDLSFDLDDKRDYENSLHKMNTIIETMTGFREAFIAEGELMLARKAAEKKAKKNAK